MSKPRFVAIVSVFLVIKAILILVVPVFIINLKQLPTIALVLVALWNLLLYTKTLN